MPTYREVHLAQPAGGVVRLLAMTAIIADPPADQAKSASDEATRIVELAKALTAHLEHSMATLESGARP
jgi:hypothetical protein